MQSVSKTLSNTPLPELTSIKTWVPETQTIYISKFSHELHLCHTPTCENHTEISPCLKDWLNPPHASKRIRHVQWRETKTSEGTLKGELESPTQNFSQQNYSFTTSKKKENPSKRALHLLLKILTK